MFAILQNKQETIKKTLFKKKKRYTQQTRQRQINVETTLNVNAHQRCLNIDVWLEMKLELTNLYKSCLSIWNKVPFSTFTWWL